MKPYTVNLTFDTFWQLKDYPHLKITMDKKIIDCKKGKLLKYNQRGFFIYGRYYKRKDLKGMIERIPEDNMPF